MHHIEQAECTSIEHDQNFRITLAELCHDLNRWNIAAGGYKIVKL